MDIMPIRNIEDWEMRLKRQDACWNCEILDRPVVCMSSCEPGYRQPEPKYEHMTAKDYWMDAEYQAERRLAGIRATRYFGDALPFTYPNLGPDFFAACFGGNLVFEEKSTSYIVPFVKDYAELDSLRFDYQSECFKNMERMYDALIGMNDGDCYIGWPDIHPGGDCLAGLRGSEVLCMDLYDYPDQVKKNVRMVTAELKKLLDFYFKKLGAHKYAVTGWPGIVSSKRWSVPSCDFAYMISVDNFNEFFLEGIREECSFTDANIFHLDGKGSLKHLDALLEIEKLNTVQWVYGAGQGRASDWIPVYQKVQAAGKGVQINIDLDELDTIMQNLRPAGVFLYVRGVDDEETANNVISRVSKWK
ncbi:MAG: hypothetical protein WCV67_15170 [Victivallaceae bacterium]